jgi:hypothetical protein
MPPASNGGLFKQIAGLLGITPLQVTSPASALFARAYRRIAGKTRRGQGQI